MLKKSCLLLVLLLFVSSSVWADGVIIELKDGKVTVDVKDFGLREVLFTIAHKAGFELAFDKGFEEKTITTKFSLPLDAALKRLLKDAAYTLDYKDGQISKLTAYPKGQRQGFDKKPVLPGAPKNANPDALAIVKALKKQDPQLQVVWNPQTGYPSFIFGKLSATSDGKPTEIAGAFLAKYAKLLGIENTQKQLAVDAKSSTIDKADELGMRHVVYQQQHEGINVYSRSVGVHIGKDGSVGAIDGNFLTGATAVGDTTADIAKENAAKLLRGDVKDVKYQDPDTKQEMSENAVSEPTLEWYPQNGQLHLAWYSEVNDMEKQDCYRVFVDADSGKVIAKENRHAAISGAGQVKTRRNGIVWKKIDYLWGAFPGGYYTFISPCNGASYLRTFRKPSSSIYWNRDFNGNSKLEWSEASGSIINGVGPTVQYNMARTLHFYNSYYYQRKSYNNSGGGVTCYVLPGVNNAYAHGSTGYFSFGEGSGGIFANLGVTTHELTHAVVFCQCNLPYSGESGACHEGLSDIMGVASMRYWYQYFGDSDCADYWNLIPVRDLKSQRTYSQYKASGSFHLGGHVLGHCVYKMATQLGTEAACWSTYYAMRYYLRNSSTLKNAYWKILYTIYLKYGYSYYCKCYYASYWPMYH